MKHRSNRNQGWQCGEGVGPLTGGVKYRPKRNVATQGIGTRRLGQAGNDLPDRQPRKPVQRKKKTNPHKNRHYAPPPESEFNLPGAKHTPEISPSTGRVVVRHRHQSIV